MHSALSHVFLIAGTLAGGLLMTAIAFSAVVPRLRVWPPNAGTKDWRFWGIWTLVVLYVASSLALGAVSFGTLGLPRLGALAVGGVAFVAGNLLAFWGAGRIGTVATVGIEDRLVTSGPYRWSRNPQYLGDVLVIAGATLLYNSAPMVIPALLGCLAAVLAPLAEEPWLRERYGRGYEEYLERVPRYF